VAGRCDIYVERKGGTTPLLVLLHGLGATGAVWQHFVEAARNRWDGGLLIIDLPGHGSSAALIRYTIADYAHALAPAIADAAAGERMTILGHSLGAVIAIALANARYRLAFDAVFALGIKVEWSGEELARLAILSKRPPRLFQTREEALVQHARMCGLGPTKPALLERGIIETNAGWQLALDGRAYAIEPPPVAALIAGSACPVHLSRGDADPLASERTIRTFDRGAGSIASAGHNAMVDRPDGVWDWLLKVKPA
jgi:pimeloyl-ACP methyl ester carboxylesterase